MADRTKLDEFVAELEAAAYQRGVDDTWRNVRQHLGVIREQIDALVSGDKQESIVAAAALRAAMEVREPREGTDQDKVLQDIRSHPGSRGVDIVNRLHGEVEERTVRTALHRLRNKNFIRNVDGLWMPAEFEIVESDEEDDLEGGGDKEKGQARLGV